MPLTELLPHQQRLIDRLQREDQPGLVAIHGLGSGKTLSALAAQEALGQPATYVVPAPLKANLEKERLRHFAGGALPSAQDVTLTTAARRGKLDPTPFLVVDEAHRLRNTGTKAFGSVARTQAKKRLLLTGSPFYNAPSDIAPLVDVAAAREVLPLDPARFNQRYLTTVESPNTRWLDRLLGQAGEVSALNPATAEELRGHLGKWVDYHGGTREGFPEVTSTDIHVPMGPEQRKLYDTLMNKAPMWTRWKVRRNLPVDKAEAAHLNAFLSGVRQISNTTAPFQEKGVPEEPKLDEAFKRIRARLDADPTAKSVIYSNYLEGGLRPMSRRLEEAKIPHALFTGDMPEAARRQAVQDYNEGKLRALLLSSAGGEGLDLKNSTSLSLLEPAWNEERLRQVIGRGARYQSHAGLPEGKRKLEVERYFSTLPRSGLLERAHLSDPGTGVDEYLASRAAEKERLNEEFRRLLPGYLPR